MAEQYHTQAPQRPAVAYNSPSGMTPNEKPVMHNQGVQAPKGSGKWSFGLFDCFSPFDTCKLLSILFGSEMLEQPN